MDKVAPLRTRVDPELSLDLARRWPHIRPVLFRTAFRLCRDEILAEDLVQEMLELVLRGDRTWNREAYPTVERFLCSVLGSVWTHRKRSRVRSGEEFFQPTYDGHDPTEDVPTSKADPEEARSIYETNKGVRGLVARVREQLDGDPVALGVLSLTESGIDDPELQAEALGRSLVEIYNARKRLRYLARKVS
jgi:DNA-directed RNA polymerase specialized sigma24 family protein